MNNNKLKQKIIDLIDKKLYSEAEKLAEKDNELKDFFRVQTMLKNTMPEFKLNIIPRKIENKILNRIYDEIDNNESFNFFDFIRESLSFFKLNYSLTISIIILVLFLGFYKLNPNKERIAYYSYKVKSNVQYIIDKVSGAKDILVFMFDKNIEKVYENLINKDKQNKEEDRKWQIKTEKNRRGSLYYYRSFLG